MLFERCHTKNGKTSLKHHIKLTSGVKFSWTTLYSSCVVAEYPAPAQGYPLLQTKEQCPESLPGLCMRKLARGYLKIEYIKYVVNS